MVYLMIVEIIIVGINYFITNHTDVTPKWFTVLWIAVALAYESTFLIFMVTKFRNRWRRWFMRDMYQMLFLANLIFLIVQAHLWYKCL